MKKKKTTWIYPLMLMGTLLILASSCKKDETTQSSKKDPVITWVNPADISYGTLLSATQLNATANVPGSFVYTPPIGTKLYEGANQNLKVDFTPTDNATDNTVSKTVKINVIHASGSGVSSAIFNPNLTYGAVTDIDDNVYKTIIIGTQTWMAENLRTTRYRDGSAIPLVTDGNAWGNLSTGAYCNYNNTSNNNAIATYSRLYNWNAVSDSRNIAPAGWHVPTDAEWTTLTDYLGGEDVAGGKLKETETSHWLNPNTDATNESGFTALPGGNRNYDGPFFNIDGFGYWASITEASTNDVWYFAMSYTSSNVFRYYFYKEGGWSVRCVKDLK